LRWFLVAVAFGLSGYFLVANVYPILASVWLYIFFTVSNLITSVSQAEQKPTRLIIIVIFVLHAALALTFKLTFFSYYVVEAIGPMDPGLGKVKIGGAETTAALLGGM
jgi:protein YIPF1/2